MSESASRKRRKPAKPNKHSPTLVEAPIEPISLPIQVNSFENSSRMSIKSEASDIPETSPNSHISAEELFGSESSSPSTPVSAISADLSRSSRRLNTKSRPANKKPKRHARGSGNASPDSCESSGDLQHSENHSLSGRMPLMGHRSSVSGHMDDTGNGSIYAGISEMVSGEPNRRSPIPLVVPPERSIMTQYEELKSKAMTSRARRIIANARERNRVHTISSAFEELRRSIPCYSSNQKLSKLAILKIATSYIRCLGHVAGVPYSRGAGSINEKQSFSELIMKCTINVLSDGKLKKESLDGTDSRSGDDCDDYD